ncbi:MAG: alanine--tRNA ligase [Deltaproteobacteria bacterium]|nr:MAG: alanine--tRNA ligase [Deltaproteobacteria bacterium]
MKGKEVRERFLKYFERHGHRILPSSSLVPQKDPTLLFTNAGMVQFKGVFLGLESIGTTRATTAQKCLRVSGKHNDLENVGYTARHHTFFEMLGNFSFGDYFKKEAIFFGWDFLVNEMGLDPERIYVSVFRDDDEAAEIWEKEIGVPKEKIFRFDEKDNFWAMGDTGPCGPCSEIIYDQGEEAGCGKPTCTVGCDCDRYLEIWNLVFMQYNRDESGKLTPLPKPSIDTGMGLERITAVVQGVLSNYDTDFFTGLINRIQEISGRDYGKDRRIDAAMRVIADHARATAFLIADGVLPSNEGRGYVLRRIMRRALRHGKKLGFSEPFLHVVTDEVVEEMGDHYGELRANRSFIEKVVLNEEERFLSTLDSGLKIFEEEAGKIVAAGGNVIPGDVVFKLYDTYGFPVDLTEDICRERGLTVDHEGFEREMEKQRERARQAWKAGEVGEDLRAFTPLLEEGVKVEFTGYNFFSDSGEVLFIVSSGQSVESASEGATVDIVTTRTPFYAEGGGQVGDAGTVVTPTGKVEVETTYRVGDDVIVHRGKVVEGEVKVGQKAELSVQEGERRKTQANHTATHVLQAALREILGDHVRQAGSYVGPDKLRFDYTHFDQPSPEELERIEEFVNRTVLSAKKVMWDYVPYDEAISKGAMALFGEKYGDVVRMVQVEGVSVELCGGTHVRNTSEIGPFVIVEERALAAGVRRIEALTGMAALDHLRGFRSTLTRTSRLLAVSPEEVPGRVEKLLEEVKRLEKEKEEIRRKALKGEVGAGELTVEKVGGLSFAWKVFDDLDVRTMRELMDEMKGKVGTGVVLLASKAEGKSSILVGVTKDLTEKCDARQLVARLAEAFGGKGGGRPDLAQTGSGDPSVAERSVDEMRKILGELGT